MTKNELMEGLNEAKELLSDRVPAIDAWIAVKALTEIIARLELCDTVQMTQ